MSAPEARTALANASHAALCDWVRVRFVRRTPLYIAVKWEKMDVVKTLAALGADLNAASNGGCDRERCWRGV